MLQNKHIIRFSFIGLFLNIIANILLYRYFMIEEVVLKQVANHNTYLAEVYKSGVWDNNRRAIEKLKDNDYSHLLTDADFILFTKSSSSFLKTTNAMVTIYDRTGKKLLSNTNHSISNIDQSSNLDSYG